MRRRPPPSPAKPERRLRGFEPAAGLLAARLRSAGEKRGFTVTRLLTHWAEVVGEDIACAARPMKVGYGREGMGATLTLLVLGARAPEIEMQKDRIRERVNACYGYNAISRVVLTQTAPAGFAEAQAAFAGAPAPAPRPAPDPALAARATQTAAGVADDGLRLALETLARNVLTRDRNTKDRP